MCNLTTAQPVDQFKYLGSDASSVPSEVSERGIKVGEQAAENWCLLRLLPVIIGDRIKDTQDQVWQLVIMLKEVVELVCALKISAGQVNFLQVHIQEYLETRKHLFPSEKLKPKHHYLLHYPALIMAHSFACGQQGLRAIIHTSNDV